MKYNPRIQKLSTYLLLILLGSGVSAQAASSVPQRVISLSPHFTEIIYDIGAQDQLVGVTSFCKFPPDAQKKEKIGGFYDYSIEKIVALKPDLVLLLPIHTRAIKDLKKLHVPFLIQNNSRIQDVLDTYDVLGKRLGRVQQAASAKKRLQDRINDARTKAKTRRPVPILFVVGHDTDSLQRMYGAGPRSFIGEIIALAGGENILKSTIIPFPLISKEQLLKKDPDVIVDSVPSTSGKNSMVKKARKSWAQLPSLRAVQRHNVYFVAHDDGYLIPGPTMLGLVEYLSKIFGEFQK
jgi:iron complex transport system substrate-binding protein